MLKYFLAGIVFIKHLFKFLIEIITMLWKDYKFWNEFEKAIKKAKVVNELPEHPMCRCMPVPYIDWEKEGVIKMFKHDLGEVVKDKVTGFKGVVVCQSKYLTGCNRYSVQSQKLEKGVPPECQHFDEDQIVSLKKNINHKIKQRAGKPSFEVPQR